MGNIIERLEGKTTEEYIANQRVARAVAKRLERKATERLVAKERLAREIAIKNKPSAEGSFTSIDKYLPKKPDKVDWESLKEKVKKDRVVNRTDKEVWKDRAKKYLVTNPTKIAKEVGKNLTKKINKSLASKAVYKSVTKKSPRAMVMVNQPVYSEDKNRFFKESWDEEKRSLYFK